VPRRPHDPGWILTLLAAGGALGLSAVLLGTRLLVPSELATIRTEAWAWTSNGVAVEPLFGRGPFRTGDVVVGIEGRPVEAWASEAFRAPWVPERVHPPLGDLVSFDVLRDGQEIAIEAPRVGFPLERLSAAPVGLVTFGVGVLLVGLVLIYRRPRATAIRALFVAAAANIADIVAWNLDLQPTDLLMETPFPWAFVGATLFNLVFWSALVHLLTIYPVRSISLGRRRWFLPVLYGGPIVAVFAGIVVARAAGGSTLDWIDRWASVQGFVASVMVVCVLAAIAAGYRRTPAPRRHEVRAIAIWTAVAGVATLALVVGPIALLGAPLVSRNTVAILALPVPVALAIAVVRNRLFQVDLLARSRERVVAAREEERRRLRRELHDGLGPSLAALGLKLDLARELSRTEPARIEPLLGELRADVRAVLAQIRTLARDLRPPSLDALGLVGAIREQVNASVGPGQVGPVMVMEAPERLPALPAAVEVAAYRIVIEAITNVIRHAGAERCEVRLAIEDDALVLTVTDDGGGMQGRASGVGTRSMHERAAEVGGEVAFEPGVDGGTRVTARLPFRPPTDGAYESLAQ
jgi:signal transduction histidine kinase